MPKQARDFRRNVIYKIVCQDLNVQDTYVGHTCNFAKRKAQHKYSCTHETHNGYNYKLYQTIRKYGGWDNWTMIEIEKFPCNDVNEASARERYWYEILNGNLNSNVPSRTQEEYREQNKSKMQSYNKDYYEQNKFKKKFKLVLNELLNKTFKF